MTLLVFLGGAVLMYSAFSGRGIADSTGRLSEAIFSIIGFIVVAIMIAMIFS